MGDLERRVRDELDVLALYAQPVPFDKVMSRLVEPLLEEVEKLRRAGERWVTLPEARRQTGRSATYFEREQARFDDRNRLQFWRDQGLAEQTAEGTWLISPAAVAAAGSDAQSDPSPVPQAGGTNPFLT